MLAWTAPLSRWAEERGHTLLELAIAWVLSHPAVTVCLCGGKSPEQVDDHVRAASWHLSTEDRREIDRLLGRQRHHCLIVACRFTSVEQVASGAAKRRHRCRWMRRRKSLPFWAAYSQLRSDHRSRST